MGNTSSNHSTSPNYSTSSNHLTSSNHSNRFNNVKNIDSYLQGINDFNGRPTNDEFEPNQLYEEKVHNKSDKRIRALPKYYNDSNKHINAIGSLKMLFGHKTYSGTAIVINRSKKSSTSSKYIYLLTAAHNVVSKDPITNEVSYAKQMWFERRQNTANNGSKIIHTYNVINQWVYPQYFNKATSLSGNDIAILQVNDDDGFLSKIPGFVLCPLMFDDSTATLVGYPGEYKGQLYGMSEKVTADASKGLIIYDKIDTSRGQSGSPLFVLGYHCSNDTESEYISNLFELSNCNNCEGQEAIIGVHVGGNQDKNWGTLLTKEKIFWILKKTHFSLAELCDGGCSCCGSECWINGYEYR